MRANWLFGALFSSLAARGLFPRELWRDHGVSRAKTFYSDTSFTGDFQYHILNYRILLVFFFFSKTPFLSNRRSDCLLFCSLSLLRKKMQRGFQTPSVKISRLLCSLFSTAPSAWSTFLLGCIEFFMNQNRVNHLNPPPSPPEVPLCLFLLQSG